MRGASFERGVGDVEEQRRWMEMEREKERERRTKSMGKDEERRGGTR